MEFQSQVSASAPPRRPARPLRWLMAGSLIVAAVVWQGQANAGGRSDQIAGAIIGAGIGAVIGQQVGGHDGAVLGGAIGAATGAVAAGDRGHRVYQTGGYGARPGHGRHHGDYGRPHRPPPVHHHAPRVGGYGHPAWAGSLAAPPARIIGPGYGYRPPAVIYHPRPVYRHGHVRGHGHHPGRAAQRAYRQGVRDGIRAANRHRY